MWKLTRLLVTSLSSADFSEQVSLKSCTAICGGTEKSGNSSVRKRMLIRVISATESLYWTLPDFGTRFCAGCPADTFFSVTVSFREYVSGDVCRCGARHLTCAPVPVNSPFAGVADHAYVS